ncbi:MAG: hypothetical protein PHY64_12085, partial [Eubacteriales bacterium]|nr:hypothetical protein [Eubacteriales bacterium]
MKKNRIPAYAVCGANVADRQAFFREFCRTRHPLWVACGAGLSAAPSPGILYLSEATSPLEAGERIAGALKRYAYDSVWLDWDDGLPIGRLLTMMQAAELALRCKLRKIVRCGDGAADTAHMAESPIGGQLAQCDLFAVRQTERREVAGIRRRITPFQPDIEVIPWEDRREISAVLEGRNV